MRLWQYDEKLPIPWNVDSRELEKESETFPSEVMPLWSGYTEGLAGLWRGSGDSNWQSQSWQG